MIGRIIGAAAGAKAAEHSKSLGGASGAVLGLVAEPLVRRVAMTVLRRFGPLGWIAAGAGAYAYKRYSDSTKAPKRRSAPRAKPA